MKRIGISMMAIGLLVALFAGLTFTTREKVVEVGGLHIIKDKKNKLDWSPIIGFAVMAIGGAVYLVGWQSGKQQSK